MKKLFVIFLVCFLVCTTFFACGKVANDAAKPEMEGGSLGSVEDGDDTLTDKVENTSTAVNPGQKMVRKVWLETETENMDPLLSGVNQQVLALGGYVESREVYNGSQYGGRRYRNAELTIRIPAEKLSGFVQHVAENANVTSNRETADDITLNYVATESRLKALQTEETRLLELLAGAKDMGDLLQIEDRLTQVRTELEQIKSRLQVYDNQVNYSTLYLSVREVTEYTVTEEPETVWERISAGFMESLQTLGDFFVELFVFAVVGLPYLVVFVFWQLLEFCF